MIIAIVGCTHGELNLIYSTLDKIEEENKLKVDLLICCGDFECIRNSVDNECLNVPNKYKKEENDFKDYYTGKKKAKVLTVFVGGNHEAVNVLKQLYYGGWVAPNIYFLGYSNVHNINNLRIASLSGIYKKYNYYKKYSEWYPYTELTKVSAYHIRKYEIEKLKLINQKVDIVITHDWPNNIEKHGDMPDLLRRKYHFHSDIYNNTLGNPHTEILLNKLKPHFWFSSHLHVKYSAIYLHNDQINYTRFLSLDKAQPYKSFIQILNIEKKNDVVSLNFNHLSNQIPVIDHLNKQNDKNKRENYPKSENNQNIEVNNQSSCVEKSATKSACSEGNILGSSNENRSKGEADGSQEEADEVQEVAEEAQEEAIEEMEEAIKEMAETDEEKITSEGNFENLNCENNSENEIKDENFQIDCKKEESVNEHIDKENKCYICYDLEWLAILKANHHLISISSTKDYNLEYLVYPTKEDFEYVENKFQNLEKTTIDNKDYFLVHGYNNPNYKNLCEQRQLFLNRFELEELNIYNESEFNFFKEEIKAFELMTNTESANEQYDELQT